MFFFSRKSWKPRWRGPKWSRRRSESEKRGIRLRQQWVIWLPKMLGGCISVLSSDTLKKKQPFISQAFGNTTVSSYINAILCNYKYLMKHVISSARDRWSKYLTKAPTTSDCTDNSWTGQSCRNVRSFLEHSQVWLVMPGHHQSQDIGWCYKRKIMNITENIKVVS